MLDNDKELLKLLKLNILELYHRQESSLPESEKEKNVIRELTNTYRKAVHSIDTNLLIGKSLNEQMIATKYKNILQNVNKWKDEFNPKKNG